MNRRQFVIAGAAGVLGAALRPMPALGSERPLVLVTADLASQVVVVDPRLGRKVSLIDTISQPRSIERVGGTAVVAHSEQGRITLIDAANIGPRPLIGRLGEPRYTAAHPDRRHAFVTDSGLGEVVVIDVVRGVVVGRVDVGGPARHLSLSPDGRRLWTALGTRARSVAMLDVARPRRLRLMRIFQPPFLAHDVVFAPAGDHVWITSGDRRTLGIFDATTRRLIRRVPADAPPQHVSFSEAGRVAYVASGDDGTVKTHALDGRLLRIAQVPVGSFNVTRGGGHVVTPSLERGTLCILDRHGQVRRTVQVADAAHDACVIRV